MRLLGSGGTALVIGGVSCLAGIGLVATLVPQLRRFTTPAAAAQGAG